MKSIPLSQKLNIQLHVQSGDQLLLSLQGAIDEDSNMLDLFKELAPYQDLIHKIEFNLSGVTQMNSCGVRSWLLMLERFPKNLEITFREACPLLVEQASMIPNILGSKPNQIKSFQAPFFCADCKQESVVVFEPNQITFRGEDPVIPTVKCSTCSQPMSFDSIESEYFFFLRRKRQAA